MATAAVLDAKNKDSCRKELDQKIRDGKEGLATLIGKSTSRDLSRAAAEYAFSFPAPVNSSLHNALYTLDALYLKPEVLSWRLRRARRRRLRSEYLRRGLLFKKQSTWWLTPPKMDEVQAYLAMEECMPDIDQREPTSAVQITKATEMIEDLVDRLLFEAYQDNGTGAAPPQGSLDSGWNTIRMLRSDGYPRYSDPKINRESSVQSRQGLNAVNRGLMAEWGALRDQKPMTYAEYYQRREHFIARLCYNLLVAPVPPGIHNYNALISGLSWIGEPQLSQAVVDSFLFKSHLKPTQMTLVSLLNHYRLQKDTLGFYRIVRRLTGHDPRGVGLRRRTSEDVEMASNSLEWAQASDVAVSCGYVVERPPLSRPLLEALLDGFIDLQETRSAARLLVACMQEGWALGTRYLARVVWLCLYNFDYRAAQTLLRGFLYNIDTTISLLLGDSMSKPQSLPDKLLHLIDLAEVGSRWRRTYTTNLISQQYLDRLRRLKRAIWMATASYDLRHARLCAKMGERILALPGTVLDEDYDPRMMPGTALHDRRSRSRKRFRKLAEIHMAHCQFERCASQIRRLLFQALPEGEQQSIGRSGVDRDLVYGAGRSPNRMFAHWSRYLTTLGSRGSIATVTSAPLPQASGLAGFAQGRQQTWHQ